MQNAVRHGKAMDYLVPAGAAIKGGDLIVFPGMVGVAATDGEEGDTIALETTEVYELPIDPAFGSGAIAQGVVVYATSTGKITPTQDAENPLTRAGVTWWPRAVGESFVQVKINV